MWQTLEHLSQTPNTYGWSRHPARMTYSNGLIKGTNKLLLYVLVRLCAPEVWEDRWQAATWDKLSMTWLYCFDKAICILNWWILPALKFCPKEILLGLVVNMSKTPTFQILYTFVCLYWKPMLLPSWHPKLSFCIHPIPAGFWWRSWWNRCYCRVRFLDYKRL